VKVWVGESIVKALDKAGESELLLGESPAEVCREGAMKFQGESSGIVIYCKV